MLLAPSLPPQATESSVPELWALDKGASRESVMLRATALSLVLAAWFGYIVPIIDLQIRNTNLGAGQLFTLNGETAPNNRFN